MMRVWLCFGLLLIGQNLFAQSADGVSSLLRKLDSEASETLGVKLERCGEETCSPGVPCCRTKLAQELSRKYAGEIRVTPFGVWTILSGYASCPAEAAKIKQEAASELEKINKCQPLVVDCVRTETPQVMLHASLWELNLKRLRDSKQEPEMSRLRQQLQEITLLQKDNQETGFVALLTKENAEAFARHLKKLQGKTHSSPSLMVLSKHDATVETANVKLAGKPDAESLLRAVLNVCPTVEPGPAGDIRLDVRVKHELRKQPEPAAKTTAAVNTQVTVKNGQSCVVGWPLNDEQFMIQVITAECVQKPGKPVVTETKPLQALSAPPQKSAPAKKLIPATPRIGVDFDFATNKTVVHPLPAPVVVIRSLPAPPAVPMLPVWSAPRMAYAPTGTNCECAEGCKCCAQAITLNPSWAGGMNVRLVETWPHPLAAFPAPRLSQTWFPVTESAKSAPAKCCPAECCPEGSCPVEGCPVEGCPVEGCPEGAKCCPPAVTVFPHPAMPFGAPVYHGPMNLAHPLWTSAPGALHPARQQHLAEAVKHLRQAGHEKLATDVEAVLKKEQRDQLETRIREQRQSLERMQKQLQRLQEDGHTSPAPSQKKVIYLPNIELEFEIAPQAAEPSAKGGDQSPLGKSVHERLLGKGREAEQQRQFAAALQCYRQAMLVAPGHPEALHRCGVIYDHLGEFQQAERCYRAALELCPKNADILNDWGYSCLRQDRLSESETCLAQAYQIAPTHQQVLHNFARLHVRLGNEDKALEMFRQATRGNETVARELLKLAQKHQQTETQWLHPAKQTQETEYFKLPGLEILTPGEEPAGDGPATEPQAGNGSEKSVFRSYVGFTR